MATFTDRKELNRAVDFLASQKFPVHTLYVVGHDVKQVDYITGRATYPRAALSGAIQGIFLGLLVGFFNSIITDTQALTNVMGIMPLTVAFSVIYSVFVASRAKGKGLKMRSQMIPTRLDLMAVPQTAQAARHLLRVTVVPQPLPGHPQQAAPTGAPAGASTPSAQGPQQDAPARPVFTPPAATNRDGSRAAGKFGLRVESAEEFESMIRQQPAPPSTNERIEAIRAEQGEQRYGLNLDPQEAEKAIRPAPSRENTENRPDPKSQD